MTGNAGSIARDLLASVEPALSNDGTWLSAEVAVDPQRMGLGKPLEDALLEINASLCGPAKLCLPAASGTLPRLIAEAPAAWPQVERWLHSVVPTGERCGLDGGVGGPSGRGAAEEEAQEEDIARGAGWQVTLRDGGGSVVQLAGTSLIFSAEFQPGEGAAETKIVAFVGKTQAREDNAGFQAACLFLARCAGGLRMVRPTLTRTGTAAVFALELNAPPRAGAAELNDCLEALSIGVRSVELETSALLTHESLAAAYLKPAAGTELGNGTRAVSNRASSTAAEAADDLQAGGDAAVTALAASAADA